MQNPPTDAIAFEKRQEIFRTLVETQDSGVGVTTSRVTIARQFGITEEQIIAIEHEGMKKEWPPL